MDFGVERLGDTFHIPNSSDIEPAPSFAHLKKRDRRRLILFPLLIRLNVVQSLLVNQHEWLKKPNALLLRLENKVEVEAVENLVNEHAQNLRPVLLELEKRFNKPMSKRTLQRFLKRLGIVGNACDAS